MRNAERIVERLLSRHPLREGLENDLTDILLGAGFTPGQDFYFSNGLHVEDPERAEAVMAAIRNSQQFSNCAYDPYTGTIQFNSESDDSAAAYDGGGSLISRAEDPADAGDLNDPNLVMCDNCGGQSHHTEECPYSFGANPQ